MSSLAKLNKPSMPAPSLDQTSAQRRPGLAPRMAMSLGGLGFMALVAVLGLQGCTADAGEDDAASSESDLRLKGTKNLGWIKDGETKIAQYENPPSYRAYSFSAFGGDLVIVDVKSTDGDRDPVAYITSDRYEVYAQHDDTLPDDFDAHVVYKVPASRGKRNYRIAFNDAANQPSTFSVTLTIRKQGTATCEHEGSVVEEGSSFPSADGCNTCTCTESGMACTERACVCNPDNEPNRKYYGTPQTCMTIRFSCPSGTRPFSNDCGCGCETN